MEVRRVAEEGEGKCKRNGKEEHGNVGVGE